MTNEDRHEPLALAERLKVARSTAGLTQEEVSQALKIARTTLVALEQGHRRVKPEELREFAKLYGVSVNALLRPSSVQVNLVPRFRSVAGASEEAALHAAKLLNDLASTEIELEQLVGQPLQPNYPPERTILPGDVREQAEDMAAELRHRLGVGLAPITDAIRILELELGIRVFVRPLQSGSLSGLFAFDKDVGACVLLNQNHPRERRALTAFHEVGHLLTSRDQPAVVDLSCLPQSREEKFATAFSLAFMMPAPGVRRRFHQFKRDAGGFSPRHLILMAHEFNVSEEALCRRLEELRLIPRGTWEFSEIVVSRERLSARFWETIINQMSLFSRPGSGF